MLPEIFLLIFGNTIRHQMHGRPLQILPALRDAMLRHLQSVEKGMWEQDSTEQIISWTSGNIIQGQIRGLKKHLWEDRLQRMAAGKPLHSQHATKDTLPPVTTE